MRLGKSFEVIELSKKLEVWSAMGQVLTKILFAQTILDKMLETKKRWNPKKLTKTRKHWHLLWNTFWLLLPKFNFKFVASLLGNLYHNFVISFYMWQIWPVLNHCKVSKYSELDCRSLLTFLSSVSLLITTYRVFLGRILGKLPLNYH